MAIPPARSPTSIESSRLGSQDALRHSDTSEPLRRPETHVKSVGYASLRERKPDHAVLCGEWGHSKQDTIPHDQPFIAHGIRDTPVPPAFVATLKAKGIWYIPTLQLDEATFAWADRAPWTQTPFARAALSPALAQQVDDPAWRAKILADPKTADARKSLAMNLRNLKTLYDAGVKIGFGTDSGASAVRVPGIAEHRELALMVEAGLTPAQAVRVATAAGADLLGL
ncbi:MAG: hypothetical protein EOP67_33565, partial [Sphingomonas sp.]